MRCGFLAVLSCLAILAAGCGTDTTNRGATNTGPRTANKPVIEDRTGMPVDTTPVPGTVTDRNMPAGQPATPDRNIGTSPSNPGQPSPTPSNTDNTPPTPDRQTPPGTTP